MAQWIEIKKDGHIEMDQEVLCTNNNNDYVIGYIQQNGSSWMVENGYESIYGVTHFKYLVPPIRINKKQSK